MQKKFTFCFFIFILSCSFTKTSIPNLDKYLEIVLYEAKRIGYYNQLSVIYNNSLKIESDISKIINREIESKLAKKLSNLYKNLTIYKLAYLLRVKSLSKNLSFCQKELNEIDDLTKISYNYQPLQSFYSQNTLLNTTEKLHSSLINLFTQGHSPRISIIHMISDLQNTVGCSSNVFFLGNEDFLALTESNIKFFYEILQVPGEVPENSEAKAWLETAYYPIIIDAAKTLLQKYENRKKRNNFVPVLDITPIEKPNFVAHFYKKAKDFIKNQF